MERVELCDEKLRFSVVYARSKLLAGAEDSAGVDMNVVSISATFTEDGAPAAKNLFHVLVIASTCQ